MLAGVDLMAGAYEAAKAEKTAAGVNILIVPPGLRDLVLTAADAAGMTAPDILAMYEAEIRDLLAGRLGRPEAYITAEGPRGGSVPVCKLIPSLLDRLKQRSNEELEQKLGKLLEPVAGE